MDVLGVLGRIWHQNGLDLHGLLGPNRIERLNSPVDVVFRELLLSCRHVILNSYSKLLNPSRLALSISPGLLL